LPRFFICMLVKIALNEGVSFNITYEETFWEIIWKNKHRCKEDCISKIYR
jgi:hypothetical protein